MVPSLSSEKLRFWVIVPFLLQVWAKDKVGDHEDMTRKCPRRTACGAVLVLIMVLGQEAGSIEGGLQTAAGPFVGHIAISADGLGVSASSTGLIRAQIPFQALRLFKPCST